jgi:hypothetical protein
MKNKTQYQASEQMYKKLQKNLDALTTLDAQYVTQYPKKMSRSEYERRRKDLKKTFNKLQREANELTRG